MSGDFRVEVCDVCGRAHMPLLGPAPCEHPPEEHARAAVARIMADNPLPKPTGDTHGS